MLKFFRNIRRKLLKENNVLKYLIYAFGEIVLVVIGILIALQINTWNESRKLKSTELSILKEISLELAQNIAQLDMIVSLDIRDIQNGEHLIKIIKDPTSVFHDSLKTKFGSFNTYTPFETADGSYETLKQMGLDIIQNDSLKIELRNLFEQTFPMIERTGNSFREKTYFQSIDVFVKYFETERFIDSKKPNDFKELKDNQEYINMLTHVVAAKRLARINYASFMQQIIQVKKFLDSKIQELE